MDCERIEVYLSGYLDQELPQQKQQEVHLHLETCPRCREVLHELKRAKKSTADLCYETPTGEEWIYAQNHILGRVSRKLGWLVLLTWLIMTVLYAAYYYATNPGEPLFEKILVFGLIVGAGLLFFSVLSERVRDYRTDRYRGVQR